jgi:hypothetical protein
MRTGSCRSDPLAIKLSIWFPIGSGRLSQPLQLWAVSSISQPTTLGPLMTTSSTSRENVSSHA